MKNMAAVIIHANTQETWTICIQASLKRVFGGRSAAWPLAKPAETHIHISVSGGAGRLPSSTPRLPAVCLMTNCACRPFSAL